MRMKWLSKVLGRRRPRQKKWPRINERRCHGYSIASKAAQRLKEQCRNDPNASQITIQAKGGQTDVPVACSLDIGHAIYQAEAQGSRRCRRLFR